MTNDDIKSMQYLGMKLSRNVAKVMSSSVHNLSVNFKILEDSKLEYDQFMSKFVKPADMAKFGAK